MFMAVNLVAGAALNGLNSGVQRLDCDFECDLPCLCNLYGLCFDVADIALGLIIVERNTELF